MAKTTKSNFGLFFYSSVKTTACCFTTLGHHGIAYYETQDTNEWKRKEGRKNWRLNKNNLTVSKSDLISSSQIKIAKVNLCPFVHSYADSRCLY